MTVYLDSSALVYLFVDNPEAASHALPKLRDAATSALTYDELVWIIRKRLGKSASFGAADIFLALDIDVLPVERGILSFSRQLMAEYDLKPRDSIHAATMLQRGIKTMVSQDKDFDRLKEIKRVSTEHFFER